MAAKKGIKAEKPALTLDFDKEAAEDLEYIARLTGQDPADTVSFALGLLKKIAEEKQRGHKTYIELGTGRREEIILELPQIRQDLMDTVRDIAAKTGRSESDIIKELAEKLSRGER
ncbi:hypothetical protein GX441_00410 [bacterium]|nr:hypothetical protein [bacterium]